MAERGFLKITKNAPLALITRKLARDLETLCQGCKMKNKCIFLIISISQYNKSKHPRNGKQKYNGNSRNQCLISLEIYKIDLPFVEKAQTILPTAPQGLPDGLPMTSPAFTKPP